ncbi:oligosaccharide flippase family protein [Roseateles asaccharophilus]|nr:oligosaccharide flippase family protein [Roseateles asaccharophilus]
MSPNSHRGGRWAMLWALGQFGAQAAAALLSFYLVARAVGPASYADYVIGLAITALAQCFGLAIFREPVVQTRHIDALQLASMAKVSVLWSLMLAGVTSALTWVWFQFSAGSAVVQYVVFLLSTRLFLDGVTAVPLASKARTLDIKLQAIASMLGSAATVSVVYISVRANLGVVGLALGQLVGQFVQSSIALYFLKFDWLWSNRIDTDIVKVLGPKSISVVSWQLIDYVNGSLDRLFISARLPAAQIGVYGFGKRLNDIVFETIGGGLGMVCLPIFSRANEDAQLLREGFVRWIGHVAFFVVPLLGWLFVVADDLILLLFGASWLSAVDIYRVFLVLGVIQAFGVVQAALIRGMGKSGVWTKYLLTQAVGNVAVVFAFSGFTGFVLALAIVAKTYLIWGYSVLLVCRLLAMRVASYGRLVAGPIFAMLFSAALAWFVCAHWQKFQGLEFISISLVLYVAFYLTLSWFVNRRAMLAAFKSLRGKS